MGMQTHLGKRLEEAWAVIDTLRGKLDASTDQIAALTAQNEAQCEALDKCARHFKLLADLASAERVKDVSHEPKRPKWQIVADEATTGANFAKSQTPAEALERAKRDAEERRLPEEMLQAMNNAADDDMADDCCLKMAERLIDTARGTLDNFRKGTGR